ncbi:MAG: hypothetical protein AAF571_07555, partial [Verrucomicrobiota bacterium]
MIIYFGHRLYGKKNVTTRKAFCPHCGAYTKLTSYDAVRYFHFFLIPLIPLGKKRVIDFCPKCKQSRIMSLKQYEALKETQMQDCMAEFKENPNSPEVAIRTLATLIEYHELEKLTQMIPVLNQRFPHDAEVQNALGSAQDFMGEPSAAIEHYQTSYGLQADPHIARNLIALLVRTNRADEAYSLFQQAFPEPTPQDAVTMTFLIEGSMHQGKPDQAQALLEQLKMLDPGFAKQKEIKALQKKVKRACKKQVAVPVEYIENRQPTQRESNGTPFWVAPTIAVTILVIFLGPLLLGFLLGMIDRTGGSSGWLVNGTSQVQVYRIGDDKITVPAFGTVSTRIPYGTFEVEVINSPIDLPPLTLTNNRSFTNGTGYREKLVLNPDCQAILVKEQTFYAMDTEQDVALMDPRV